jgi:hypothetical protein
LPLGWPGCRASACYHAVEIAADTDHATAEVMRPAGVSKPCVWRWQRRFVEARVDGLLCDKIREPSKAPVLDAVVKRLGARSSAIRRARPSSGPAGRRPAPWLGDQHAEKIWRAYGLAPHRLRTFKLSREPKGFGEMLSLSEPGGTPLHSWGLSYKLIFLDVVGLSSCERRDDAVHQIHSPTPKNGMNAKTSLAGSSFCEQFSDAGLVYRRRAYHRLSANKWCNIILKTWRFSG